MLLLQIPEGKLIDPGDDRFVSRASRVYGTLGLAHPLKVLKHMLLLEVPEGVG